MQTKRTQKNIPNGWEEIPVDKVFTFVKSYAFSRDNLIHNTSNNEGIGNIHYGDIHATFSTPSIDMEKVSVPMVKDRGFAPKSGDRLIDGDLIMADVSEDYAGIGVTVSVHGLNGKKIVGGLHTFVLRDNKNKTDKYFRQYIFHNPKIRNSLQKVANGVSVYGISKTALSKLLLPIPPLPEQNRIVAVLETWDKAIEKLTKKIEVKKAIKKGLMQELLTGKTRLHGFTDKWKTVELRDISISLDNKRIPLNSEDREKRKGQIPYCGANGVVNFIDNFLFDEDIILIAEDGGQFDEYSCRPIAYRMTGKCWVNNHAHVIKAKNGFSQDLLFYLTVHKNILKYLNGGTRAKLNKSELLSIEYFVPSSEKEQVAIANALNVADKELKELEKKLSLLTNQKKYLLNNLITGAIRTPETLKIRT